MCAVKYMEECGVLQERILSRIQRNYSCVIGEVEILCDDSSKSDLWVGQLWGI